MIDKVVQDILCGRCVWRSREIEGKLCPYSRCAYDDTGSNKIHGDSEFRVFADRTTHKRVLVDVEIATDQVLVHG